MTDNREEDPTLEFRLAIREACDAFVTARCTESTSEYVRVSELAKTKKIDITKALESDEEYQRVHLLIPFFIIYCIYDGFFPCDPIQKIVDQLRGKKEKTPKEKFKDVLSKLGECTFNVLMFPALVCMICVIVILCPIKSFNAFTASFPKWF